VRGGHHFFTVLFFSLIVFRFLQQKVKFWFATGGAGFCLSRALALKMMPVASGGKFIGTGEKIRLPDDVTMGYIIEHLLKKPLTVVDQFHSHLEPMKFIRREILEDQVRCKNEIQPPGARIYAFLRPKTVKSQ
jgi:hypothetical protein